MQLTTAEAEKLIREGVDALRAGRPADARARLEAVTSTGRANSQVWLVLASACRADNDLVAEEAALDSLLRIEPRAVLGHIMKADCRLRDGDDRAAARFYRGALLIAEGQRLPNELLGEVRRAEAMSAQVEARLDAHREAMLNERGLPREMRSGRFQDSLDISAGRKQIFLQEPTAYYFPGLPQIQFYDRTEFDWVPAVESATSAVRAEIADLLRGGPEGFRPYILSDPNHPRLDKNPLLDSIDWSALFLCENGKVSQEIIARCPKTWETVQQAPLVRIDNVGPTVMFSLLRPGARIVAHTGMFNTRLTCHLPLIVPPNCRFRVGNEVREWEEGKMLIFDDTIEHEAWNESNEDRVVLIFDIWRPELTEQERHEISVLFRGPSAGE